MLAETAMADEGSFSQIQRGRYLVLAGDCAACHTTEDGGYLAGGLPIPTPFGEIYSANLTPDDQTGLGNWNQQQFIRAMREGVRADGAHLYPAFPYPSFTHVTDEDLAAIWSYLRTIDPVHNAIQQPDLIWPLGWRQLVAGWKAMFFEPGVYEPDPDKSAQWNRGAYLVEGLGHCGSCHTPKNVFGAADEDARYTGSELQQWFAPSLRGGFDEGLGDWSKENIVEYLKTGANGDHVAAGLMREVIEKSTQHMTDEDLTAIATYLKDLPGGGDRVGQTGPDTEGESVPLVEQQEDGRQEESQTDDGESGLGRALYVDNCTGCHGYDGEGIQNVFPELRDSPIVQQDNPASLIHVVLRGAREPNTEARPNLLSMPNFDWKLDDDQIAALLTYIRGAWGNDASAVSPDTVADLREATTLEATPVEPE
ncbi:cytochrome c [Halomonas shantousis]